MLRHGVVLDPRVSLFSAVTERTVSLSVSVSLNLVLQRVTNESAHCVCTLSPTGHRQRIVVQRSTATAFKTETSAASSIGLIRVFCQIVPSDKRRTHQLVLERLFQCHQIAHGGRLSVAIAELVLGVDVRKRSVQSSSRLSNTPEVCSLTLPCAS